jgi:lycopene cyclase domain-containing protein
VDYLLFDLLVLALPAALLLRSRRLPLLPVAVLAATALAWTAPWDEHLVRTGVWSYAPDQVLARLGSVPVEEYAFVVLEVVLVGAWALHTGVLVPRPLPVAASHGRGAAGWAAVGAAGVLLLLLGGPLRYAGLLLVWAAPPLALQHAVAGDVLADRRARRLATALPVALWLCLADRLALAAGIWTISPGSSTGWTVLGLPVEEAAFFGLTAVLVTDGLLLAADPGVRARAAALLHGRPRRTVGG